MSNIQTFFGPPAVTGVFGNTTTATVSVAIDAQWLASNNIVSTPCGAITAGVYKTLLTVTGAGYLNFAAVFAVVTGDVTLRITVDGVVISTKLSALSTGRVAPSVGAFSGAAAVIMQELRFNKSLLIAAKSTDNTTDGFNILTNYTRTSCVNSK